MNSCKNCSYALFDKLWGDFKCKLDGLYRYDRGVECPDHKEGEPEISKGVENIGR